MKEINVIPATLAALRNMKDLKFRAKSRPCYAIFHDNINNIHKIFSHSTGRTTNKYLYMNTGALKNGIRAYLEYNAVDTVKNKFGIEVHERLTSKQIDESLKYLFDNGFIEIVYPFEDDEDY